MLGILTAGLRHGSRVVTARMNEDIPLDTLMLAELTDATRAIVYGLFSKKNSKHPDSIVEALKRKPKQTDSEAMTFKSGADFDAYYEQLLQRIKDNG